MALVAGAAVAQSRVPRAVPTLSSVAVGGAPFVSVDTRQRSAVSVSPALFGLGTDLSAATYSVSGDSRCVPLAGAEQAVTLVRIGATKADDYDWRTDSYYNPLRPRQRVLASFGCTGPRQPGATVLRVLDRVSALGINAVVVLNGEVDDPQDAAALVRLVVRRYGLAFARRLYWEIGNAPSVWQHFGVPLTARRAAEHIPCLPDQYAALVTSYAVALQAALDHKPPRIVADEWIANATDQSWTGVVTAVDTQYSPYNAPEQPLSAVQIARGVSAQPRPDSTTLDQQLESLRGNLNQYQQGGAVRLFVGQWSVDADSQTPNALYTSPAQAVFAASLLLHLARDGVSMAAWAPPLYTGAQAPLANGRPTPGFRVFAALRALTGAQLLNIRASIPAGLETLAARLPDRRIAVVLTNASARGVTLQLRLGGISSAAPASVQTFAAQATVTHTRYSSATRVAVPALGVVLVTV